MNGDRAGRTMAIHHPHHTLREAATEMTMELMIAAQGSSVTSPTMAALSVRLLQVNCHHRQWVKRYIRDPAL